MRRSPSLGALVALVLAIPVTGYAATPAAAGTTGTTETTTLVGDREFALGVYHDGVGPKGARDVVGIAGRLSAADDGEPLVGREVTLQRKLARGAGWRAVDTGETLPAEDARPAGWAIFFTEVAGNAKYRVVFAGDATDTGSRTEAMPVHAMRDFNARKVERRQRVWLRGNINPGWGGKPVAWQKKECRRCDWRTIDAKRAGDTGRWRFRGGYPPVGDTWRFRARLKDTPRFVASVSGVLVTRTVRDRGGPAVVSSLR